MKRKSLRKCISEIVEIFPNLCAYVEYVIEMNAVDREVFDNLKGKKDVSEIYREVSVDFMPYITPCLLRSFDILTRVFEVALIEKDEFEDILQRIWNARKKPQNEDVDLYEGIFSYFAGFLYRTPSFVVVKKILNALESLLKHLPKNQSPVYEMLSQVALDQLKRNWNGIDRKSLAYIMGVFISNSRSTLESVGLLSSFMRMFCRRENCDFGTLQKETLVDFFKITLRQLADFLGTIDISSSGPVIIKSSLASLIKCLGLLNPLLSLCKEDSIQSQKRILGEVVNGSEAFLSKFSGSILKYLERMFENNKLTVIESFIAIRNSIDTVTRIITQLKKNGYTSMLSKAPMVKKYCEVIMLHAQLVSESHEDSSLFTVNTFAPRTLDGSIFRKFDYGEEEENISEMDAEASAEKD